MTDEQNNKPKGAFIPAGQPQQEPVKGTLAHANQGTTTSAAKEEPVEGTLAHANQGTATSAAKEEPVKGTLAHANQPTPLPTPTVQPQQIKPTVVPTAEEPADKSTRTTAFDESIRQIQAEIDRRAPETEEQRKKRERMERSKKVIGAVSDGLRALSNLFFTAKGAPSMYDPNSSMIKVAEKKAKEAEAKREAGDKERLAMLERLGNMKLERDKFNMTADELKQRMKLANEKAQREQQQQEWLEELQPDKVREQKGKADKSEADAETAQTNAGYADEIAKSKLNNLNKQGKVYDSQVEKNHAQAAAVIKNARGEYEVQDKFGNTHYFKNGDAAKMFAKRNGTWQDQSRTITETDKTEEPGLGGTTKTTTKTTTRKVLDSGYPKFIPKSKPDNTPPSRRNKKSNDNTPPSRR